MHIFVSQIFESISGCGMTPWLNFRAKMSKWLYTDRLHNLVISIARYLQNWLRWKSLLTTYHPSHTTLFIRNIIFPIHSDILFIPSHTQLLKFLVLHVVLFFDTWDLITSNNVFIILFQLIVRTLTQSKCMYFDSLRNGDRTPLIRDLYLIRG